MRSPTGSAPSPTTPTTLRATIEDQLIRADLVVTSGGVSVGAYDVVKEVLSQHRRRRAASVEFRRLAMQPGKPQGFGLIGPDRTPILALPGNPVSVVRLLRAVRPPGGAGPDGPRPVRRQTARAVLDDEERADVARTASGSSCAAVTSPGDGGGAGTVRPVGGAGSHLVAALAQANALIDVPEKTTRLAPGGGSDRLD